METENNSEQSGLSLEALEAELRQMPAPDAPAELEAKLLADIPAAKRAPRMWYRVPLVRAAAAAAVIAAVVFGFILLGGGASLTLAQVQDAVAKKSWVHVKYDNSRERWVSLDTGTTYLKGEAGRVVFVDGVSNIRQTYEPAYGQHILQSRHYRGDAPPSTKVQTAWKSTVGPLEQMVEQGSVGYWKAKSCSDRLNGKQLVRFDLYFNDAAGRCLLIRQIWADPEARLPVKIRNRLSLAERKSQNRDFITGVFDFPETGPSSIYDLGVPRSLRIVKSYDGPADPAIAKVLKAGKKAAEQFPSQHLVLVWQNEGSHEVDIIYRDGIKAHQARYFSLHREPYHLPVPATSAQVLEWTQKQVAVDMFICDGKNRYRKTTPHPAFPEAKSQPVVRVTRGKTLDVDSWPHDKQWPYVNRQPGNFRRIEDPAGELSSYVGLRIDSGDIRRDFYIDPEHDYICVRWIWWKERSGKWEKEREYELSGFSRLPGGPWYAAKCVLITYPDPEKGIYRGGADWIITIKVLEKDEYPPDVFDGKKLLRGAKVETY